MRLHPLTLHSLLFFLSPGHLVPTFQQLSDRHNLDHLTYYVFTYLEVCVLAENLCTRIIFVRTFSTRERCGFVTTIFQRIIYLFCKFFISLFNYRGTLLPIGTYTNSLIYVCILDSEMLETTTWNDEHVRSLAIHSGTNFLRFNQYGNCQILKFYIACILMSVLDLLM